MQIDECQEWSDRAKALASYAKQAHDDDLHRMAVKIKARAIDRCGELLRQIETAKNQHDAKARASDGGGTRTQAAQDAGLSKRQQVTAVRVNNVPRDDFEALVESANPPSITTLAWRRVSRYLI